VAFNARTPDADPWTEDAEIEAPGAALSGRAAVLGFLGVFQEAFPDGRLAILRLLVKGSEAAAEGVFTGVHTGVLHTPAGDVSPTGRPVAFRWAAAYGTRDDKLASEHLYFDQHDFLAQLGLLSG
jgi:predicted ester cyclase